MRTIFVDGLRVLDRRISRFPLVVYDDGSADMDIMRYLLSCLAGGGAIRSLETYATHLRDFHSQILVDKKAVGEVTDAYLSAYHEAIKNRASMPYASQVVRTVIAFLSYLEEKGKITGVIGETSRHAVRVSRTKNGSISYRLARGGKTPKSNQFPSIHAIDAVKCAISHAPELSERFSIMIDWCHVRGLRAMEVCALRVSQLADRGSVERALEDDRVLEVRLSQTKGGKPRMVEVHPLLLARTWKWIDTGRVEIQRAFRRKARAQGIMVPMTDAIFLSGSTGVALTPKAFSNAIRKAFKRAVAAGELTEAERVWAHGLRKRMINREVRNDRSNNDGRKERELMHQTGHGSLAALGRYVADPV